MHDSILMSEIDGVSVIRTNRMQLCSLGDVDSTAVRSVSEAEVAQWRRALGRRVVLNLGHWWEEMGFGIYQPISLLAQLAQEHAGLPTPFAVGARAALADSDTLVANGAIPAHVLTDLASYDLGAIQSNRRNRIKKSLRLVQFAPLSREILRTHGYPVLVSSFERSQHRRIPSRAAFEREVAASPPWRVIIGGFVDGELMGYIDGFAINAIGYGSQFVINTRALPTCIGSGLTYHIIQAFRRSGEIREVMTGLHTPEDVALCAFKKEFGFHVRRVPASVHIRSWARWFIRRHFPEKYYRLTGELITQSSPPRLNAFG